MTISSRRGFTIIETILFLAISGLVLLIGFYGIGSRTQSAQYNDSIRDMESVVSQSLNELATGYRASGLENRDCGGASDGVNLPSGGLGNQPGTTRCINMGTVIEVLDDGEDDVINVYQITGDLLWGGSAGNDFDGTDIEVIGRSNPQLNLVDSVSHDITWGTQFFSKTLTDSSGIDSSDVHAFGLVRSPKSSNVYPVAITSPLDTDVGQDITQARFDAVDPFSIKYCFEGVSGLFASINFSGSLGVDALVDSDDEDCGP